MLIPVFFFGAVLVYVLLQMIATARLRGVWRLASLAPLGLVAVAAWQAGMALADADDYLVSILIGAAPAGVVYLVLLLLAHRLLRRFVP